MQALSVRQPLICKDQGWGLGLGSALLGVACCLGFPSEEAEMLVSLVTPPEWLWRLRRRDLWGS